MTKDDLCILMGCISAHVMGSYYCEAHRKQLITLGLLNEHGAFVGAGSDKVNDPKPSVGINTTNNYQIVGDHIKIVIEQSAKGARVTATLERQDHDIVTAVDQAVAIYRKTCSAIIEEKMLADKAFDEEQEAGV